MDDGSFTKASRSADTGDRRGSQARQTIAATAPPGVANGSSRSPGFVGDSAGDRTSARLSNIGTALDVGRLRRAVRFGDRAHLDRRARKHTGRQAAEAGSLRRGGLGIFSCCICDPTDLLDKSCERTSPACPATDQRIPCVPRHGSWVLVCGIGSTLAGGILVLFFGWLFRNSLAVPASRSGCPVWRRRGSRDQCRLAHCVPLFDPVACAGSARSRDHRHRDPRSTHWTFLGKSQIVHWRQTFLSGSAPLSSKSLDMPPSG